MSKVTSKFAISFVLFILPDRRRLFLLNLLFYLICLWPLIDAQIFPEFLRSSRSFDADRQNGGPVLQAITALEAPFIYSESGPYRGYSVDVINEISAQIGFNYSLRQSSDGQIGSIESMNGIYGELSNEYADFAIGDISRNWLNDEKRANNAGIYFTKPILVSTLSVLLSKRLLHDLTAEKRSRCERQERSYNTLLHMNDYERRHQYEPQRSFQCHNQIVTFEDIVEWPALNRLIVQGSAVHAFVMRHWPQKMIDFSMVEKISLLAYGGIEKLHNQRYVLIDESKFTEHFADHNCQFDVIDGSGRLRDKSANVHIDDSTSPASSPLLLFADDVNRNDRNDHDHHDRRHTSIAMQSKFRNEIVIALSSSLVPRQRSHQPKSSSSPQQRNWLHDFDRAISKLENSGNLRRLQDRHWRANCRLINASNGAGGWAQFAIPIELLAISSIGAIVVHWVSSSSSTTAITLL